MGEVDEDGEGGEEQEEVRGGRGGVGEGGEEQGEVERGGEEAGRGGEGERTERGGEKGGRGGRGRRGGEEGRCGVDRNVVRLLRDRTEGNTMEKVWRQTFQAPPAHKQLPTARLLRHAFLLAEANNVQDYRSQILSTFGTVMKMDSTKKAVKKLSGQGRGSAEWFTSIGNELLPDCFFCADV
ncbi:hypothetical protein KUCAC02_026640 [Chaenocephalus aceratus]|nr:hypothetical protein KUCAC02_026640 [Chaenocephalus aceratus]